MKSIFKKAPAVVMSSVLLAGLAACSGGGSTADGTGSGAKDDSKDVYKIDVYSQLANFSGKQGGWFAKVIKDKFGIEMNIISQNLEGGANKYATQMASGNLGDLVVFGTDGQDYLDAIKAGALLDWTKDGLLDKYGQDIVKTLPQAIDKQKKFYGDGKSVYGIGFDAAANGASGPSEGNTMTYQLDMRWDLYQKMGSPKIKTMEDILPVLKKMQELEPKSDSGRPTYGFSLWSDWDGNMMTLAKQFACMYGYDESNMLLVSADQDKYQGLLDADGFYLRTLKLYYDANQMGLVDPDSLTQKFDDVSNKYRDGQVLFSWFPWLDSAYNTPNHTDQGKGFEMVGFDQQRIYSYGQNPYGGNRIWSIGSKAKHPEKLMQLIDWLYTPEGVMTMTNGPEGLTWEMKDGKAVLTDFGKKALRDGTTQVPDQWGGGQYKDGTNQINNTTLKISNINPNTGEPYDWNSWSSVLKDNPNPVDKSWRETTGALTPHELLQKNNQLAINKALPEPAAVMDQTLNQKLNQVATVIKQYSWKMVFAKNDSEFNQLKDEMISKAKGLGYDDLVKWQAEQTQKVFAQRKQGS
ncbi:extracellular solute-binding protein [Paenibacillus humicola]|uniref:extracellular solute-binding protein n=1 Tax=Paenibacillus humicola TaxID=3110540 RepID=UPI00237C3CA0|nr:extracellular solute-binding protein [Paenibacillus humicola]